MKRLNTLLESESITEYAVIDFEKLQILNPRLLKANAEVKSAVVFLIPYRHKNVKISDSYNVGLFARCMDYHVYAGQLFDKLIPRLKALYGGEIYGFADHSPIHEKDAAQMTGLGFIGKNGLLINPKYGSFVFIAEFLFTSRLPEKVYTKKHSCGKCNACMAACPTGALESGCFCREKCLSAVSQKKSKTDKERAVLNKTRTVWGCDICQNACPYNKNCSFSNIEYFKTGFIGAFMEENVCSFDDAEYNRYPFSFRPRAVLAENFLTVNNKCDIIQ